MSGVFLVGVVFLNFVLLLGIYCYFSYFFFYYLVGFMYLLLFGNFYSDVFNFLFVLLSYNFILLEEFFKYYRVCLFLEVLWGYFGRNLVEFNLLNKFLVLLKSDYE